MLSLRYRFSPQRNWNWWLGAGMGSLAVTYGGDSDDAVDAAQQSTLQFAVGLERRWSRFALQTGDSGSSLRNATTFSLCSITNATASKRSCARRMMP